MEAQEQAKKKEEVKKEAIHTEHEKVVEIEMGEFNIAQHSTYQALSKFCNLYIGAEENFLMLRIQDVMIENQKQFQRLHQKIYEEVYGEPMPRVPKEFKRDELSEEELKEIEEKNVKFGKQYVDLTMKKVEIKYLSVEISKKSLEKAIERELKKEENGKPATVITPNDINILRRFIDFV